MMSQMTWCCGGWVLWLMFIALLVVGVVILVKALADRSGGGSSNTSALAILEERFARGEIDGDEFEMRRRTLRS